MSAENFAHQLRDFMYWDLIIYMTFSEKQNYFIKKRHAVLVFIPCLGQRSKPYTMKTEFSLYVGQDNMESKNRGLADSFCCTRQMVSFLVHVKRKIDSNWI